MPAAPRRGTPRRATPVYVSCKRLLGKKRTERTKRLHLDLEADADGLRVRSDGREVGVAEEEHHPRVVLPDDVVEVDLGGVLVVVLGDALFKGGVGVLA